MKFLRKHTSFSNLEHVAQKDTQTKFSMNFRNRSADVYLRLEDNEANLCEMNEEKKKQIAEWLEANSFHQLMTHPVADVDVDYVWKKTQQFIGKKITLPDCVRIWTFLAAGKVLHKSAATERVEEQNTSRTWMRDVEKDIACLTENCITQKMIETVKM
jgi:hypothetical protein